MQDQLYDLGVHELQQRVRTREVSPTDIVDRCVERIEQLNPRLNAFAVVLADQARAQAQQAHDEIRHGRWRGPLHGVPVGIKDFYRHGRHRDDRGVRTVQGTASRGGTPSVSRD